MKYWIGILAIAMLATQGCKKEDQAVKDQKVIEDYLEEKGLTANKTDEGVYYIITKEGTGDVPTVIDDVVVHYKGYTLKDFVFDSSYDRGEKASFNLAGVIEGWKIALPLLKEGGKGSFFIPSELAYGENPPRGSGIGKNEVLAFDIELFTVVQ